MKVAEFKRLLRRLGCYPIGGSKHEHWLNPKTGAIAPVSRHDGQEIKTGTAERIKKMLGL
ncbi:MAG: type II toxin-antitoxin system HicA family toxin [Selenomonadaceae bacterium]|nr:type II toxin-antitoxin system HicA family toxin [Selenomonadaceae bacterium]